MAFLVQEKITLFSRLLLFVCTYLQMTNIVWYTVFHIMLVIFRHATISGIQNVCFCIIMIWAKWTISPSTGDLQARNFPRARSWVIPEVPLSESLFFEKFEILPGKSNSRRWQYFWRSHNNSWKFWLFICCLRDYSYLKRINSFSYLNCLSKAKGNVYSKSHASLSILLSIVLCINISL